MNKINPNIPPSHLNPTSPRPIAGDGKVDLGDWESALDGAIESPKKFASLEKWADGLNPSDPNVQSLKEHIAKARNDEADISSIANDIAAINTELPEAQQYNINDTGASAEFA